MSLLNKHSENILRTHQFLSVLQYFGDTLVQLEGPGLRRRAKVLRDGVYRRLGYSSVLNLVTCFENVTIIIQMSYEIN